MTSKTYSKGTVKVLRSLNICLQEVTGFTPVINHISRFLSLSIHDVNSTPETPPQHNIPNWSGILQIKSFGSSTDLDFLQRLYHKSYLAQFIC
jgi:hypothetical protein